MLAEFDVVPSLPVQNIKEKPKSCGQRITKGNNPNKIGPSPYCFIINVHLMDINVFGKFDEIPSLPVPVIKEKPKCCGIRITKGNNFKRIGP